MSSIASPAKGTRSFALLGAAIWAAAVVCASLSGLLHALGQTFMPGFALLVALGIGVPVALYFSMGGLRRTVDAFGLRRLTFMHIWRVPAALLFRGELPSLFWLLAGIGDFLAGSLAATLFWRKPTPALYRRIHVFGFVDFVTAVGTGLTFTLLQDPRMTLSWGAHVVRCRYLHQNPAGHLKRAARHRSLRGDHVCQTPKTFASA